MAESSAAIEYDPVAPIARRRGLRVALLVVTVPALLGGIGGWMLRGWVDARSPDAVAIGQVSKFPPGSVTEVVLDVGHFDPFGLESPAAELPTGREVSETRLFVVSDSVGGLVALSQRSPWMGCRVGVVTRAQAIEFGYELPAGFDRGFLDPCHGSLWSLDGQHLAGPGHRGLNRFPVSYLPDGSVVVDLTAVQPAASSPLAPVPIGIADTGRFATMPDICRSRALAEAGVSAPDVAIGTWSAALADSTNVPSVKALSFDSL